MTALTIQELLDIDPWSNKAQAYNIAIRHAWNHAVYAETQGQQRNNAAIAQAWAQIAQALK